MRQKFLAHLSGAVGLKYEDVRRDPSLVDKAVRQALDARVMARGDSLAGKMALLNNARLMCYQSFATLVEINALLSQDPGGERAR